MKITSAYLRDLKVGIALEILRVEAGQQRDRVAERADVWIA